MHVLVTVKPRMYRETLALALLKHRPDAEVLIGPADSLDGEVTAFEPDLLVHNDNDGQAQEYLDAIPCRIEVLFSDGMDVRVNLGGHVRKIEDMSVKDLVSVLDEAEAFISGESAE